MAGSQRLYDELGVEKGATQDEIDKAYRRRARDVHPDTGGTAEAFHTLSHAHAVLSDAERRRAYDDSGYEGELNAESITDRAMGRINELVISVLDSDIAFESVDLIEAIRTTLTQQKVEIGVATRKLEKQAKRADALALRFRKRSGDNLIRPTLERRAVDARERAEATRREEAVFAKAIELLADYSFVHEVETPPDEKPAARASLPFPLRSQRMAR